MVQESHGMHHAHKRKRRNDYPHKEPWKRFLDKAIYVVALTGVVMTVPQVYKIWVGQNAAGVSALSWGVYGIVAVFWLLYGIAHKEKPIIVTNVFWILLDISIVIGTMLYG